MAGCSDSPENRSVFELVSHLASTRFPTAVVYREFRCLAAGVSAIMLPLGVVPFIWQIGTPWAHRLHGSRSWTQRPDECLGGPFDRAYGLSSSTHGRVFTVEFLPGTAGWFLPFPVSDLGRIVVAPIDVWGRTSEAFLDRLSRAGSPPERARIADQFLAARWKPAHRLRIERIGRALERLRQTGGATAVKVLAQEADLSPARFRRCFAEAVGLPPKTFLRIWRINRVAAARRADPSSRLTDLAHETGYADQAHFNHDFRGITGCSPTEFFST